MALPPNQLTLLLYDAADRAAMVRALVDSGSLNDAGLADLDAVGRLLDAAEAEVAALGPGFCGPTSIDRAAARLAAADLLSAAGERRHRASPQRDPPPPPVESARRRRRFAWWRRD